VTRTTGAAVATAWAVRVLPAAVRERAGLPELRASWFVCPRSGPLLVGALLIGLASSVYWTFAVDLLASAGSLTGTQSRGFLAVVGVASVAGVVSGDATRRLGAAPTFVAALGAEAVALALLALTPGSVVVAALSAVLFGFGYNVAYTVSTLWSARVFEHRPSAGLAAVMFVGAAGLLLGPPLAGLVADHTGMRAVFAGAAAVLAATALLAPRGDALER